MKRGWTILLVSGVFAIGVLFLALAYSMVWRLDFIEKLVQYASAIGFGCFGFALLYSCFRFLPELWRKV